MVKKITLDSLAALVTKGFSRQGKEIRVLTEGLTEQSKEIQDLTGRMESGFAKQGKEIQDLTGRVEGGFAKQGKNICDLTEQMTSGFAKQGKEIRDLTASISFVVKHMATKDDVAELRTELKGDIGRVQTQVSSIEQQLRPLTRLEPRVMDLEERVFGKARG